jgi:DNA-nicking Smr family endonuclease
MKINALSDLKLVKKEIEAQAARAAALAAHKAAEAKRKAAASNLFQAAIGKVKPMEPPQRAKLAPEPPKPIPKQQMLDEAAALQEALSDEIDGAFIRESHRNGIRCVRVVHGKGLGSPGKAPVLKEKVHKWLVQKAEVVAFVQAQPAQGGAGALVVLLQPLNRVTS